MYWYERVHDVIGTLIAALSIYICMHMQRKVRDGYSHQYALNI